MKQHTFSKQMDERRDELAKKLGKLHKEYSDVEDKGVGEELWNACAEEYVKPLVAELRERCVCPTYNCGVCKLLKRLGFDDE